MPSEPLSLLLSRGSGAGGHDASLGQPAAEAESLGGENTEAVRARQDRPKKAAKAADEKRSSLIAIYGDISRFFVTSTTQPQLPPRANFVSGYFSAWSVD